MSSADTLADGTVPAPQQPSGDRRPGGHIPFVVVGAALAAGIVLAKWIDWRGHGHSRG